MATLWELAKGTQQILPTAWDRYEEGQNAVESLQVTRYIGTKMAVATAAIRASRLHGGGMYQAQIAMYATDAEEPDPNARVGVRCSCPAYYYWFSHANRVNGAAHGARFAPYVRKTPIDDPRYPPKNPHNVPGLCKHLLVLTDTLTSSNFFKKADE